MLVTGTGRCGTGYIQRVLEAVTPEEIEFGHEAVFGPDGFRGEVNNKYGDVSWLAAPFIPDLKKHGVAIIHLVRHPLAVIRSLRGGPGDGFFSPTSSWEAYKEWAIHHTPGIMEMPEDQRPGWFYFWWNSIIEPFADCRIQIESFNRAELRKVLWYSNLPQYEDTFLRRMDKISKTYNSKPRKFTEWANIAQPLRGMLQHMGERYGYGIQGPESD